MRKLGPKPRWTLGTLMILIAIIAVPLAIHDHHRREEARQQAAQLNYIKRLVGDWHEQVLSSAVGGGTSR